MIKSHDVPGTNIVELTIDGTISREELEILIAKFSAVIREHGKVRLLEVVRSFGGMSPSTFWEDLKFEFKHLGDFSHVAVVGEAKWLEMFTKFVNPLLSAEIRHFDAAELDAAREWLRSAS